MAEKALDFDKIDDIVTVSAAASLNNIFDGGGSVEAWIKPDSPGELDTGYIVNKGVTGGWILHCRFAADGGKIKIAFIQGFTTTAGAWYTTDYEVTLGAWNYIAVTYDSSSADNDPIVYVNGSPVAITEDGAPEGTRRDDSALDLELGNRTDKGRTFEGIIEEVRLSTKIRTSTEISNAWNGGSGIQLEVDGDTVALWHMNEGADATIYDETDNDNDGTIDGAGWVDGYSFIRVKSSSDTGSGADAKVALLAALAKSDTGSGVDAFTGNRGFILPETGVGVEALGDRIFDATEVGLGADELLTLVKLVNIIALDHAIGIDRFIALIRTLSKGSDIKLPSGTPGETAIPPGEVSIPSFEVHL